jgi:hypothetical protein
MGERDLIGQFVTTSAEARYLKQYYIGKQKSAFNWSKILSI